MTENWFEKGTEKEGKPSKGLREKQRRGAVGKSKIVVFGGLVDKRFINNLCVYDIENK